MNRALPLQSSVTLASESLTVRVATLLFATARLGAGAGTAGRRSDMPAGLVASLGRDVGDRAGHVCRREVAHLATCRDDGYSGLAAGCLSAGLARYGRERVSATARQERRRLPTRPEWSFALAKTGLGAFLLLSAHTFARYLLPSVTGGLDRHGWHSVSAALWRVSPAVVRLAARGPACPADHELAGGRHERGRFLGQRWNTAYRDIIYRFVFRPCTNWLGVRTGTAVGFFLSGLIHELVVSVPAGGGYGLPTLYFCLQCPALFVERSRWGRGLVLGRGLGGWLFAAAVLLIPAGLLFHAPFIDRVILPMLHDWRILP